MKQNLVISGLGPFISHVYDFFKFIISLLLTDGFFFITINFIVKIPYYEWVLVSVDYSSDWDRKKDKRTTF